MQEILGHTNKAFHFRLYSVWEQFSLIKGLLLQVEDYEEEPLLRTGCKEYFWLLCKLIDNIHVKDASQVGPSHHSTDDHHHHQ